MKLSLLEDGVLDYKGNARVLATPSADPAGALGAGVKQAPPKARLGHKARFEQHIQDCPSCIDTLCTVGEMLSKNL